MDDSVDAPLTPPLHREALQAEEMHWEKALPEVALDDKPFSHMESERISDGVVRGEDREAEFEDAEALLDGDTNVAPSAMSTAASVSGGIRGVKDEDGREESGSASEESYDSAVERMATAIPPVGSFKAQQAALKQLNEWNSGDSSLDSSLLDQFGEDEFKSYVIKIAEGRNLSADDEVVVNMLDSLLPVVRERNILLNLTRENNSLQASHESFGLPGNRAEVELQEKKANPILGDVIGQGHDDYREEQDGHDKLDNCVEGYDGDVEGDVHSECRTNRMGPDSNGMNVKLSPVFSDQGSHKSDEDLPHQMCELTVHESGPEEDSSYGLPESDANFFSESDGSRNVEAEVDSMEADADVNSEGVHADREDTNFTQEFVQKQDSNVDGNTGEDDDANVVMPDSPSQTLEQQSELRVGVGNGAELLPCVEQIVDDRTVSSCCSDNGATPNLISHGTENLCSKDDSISYDVEQAGYDKLATLSYPCKSAELSLSVEQMEDDGVAITFLSEDGTTPKLRRQDFKMAEKDLPCREGFLTPDDTASDEVSATTESDGNLELGRSKEHNTAASIGAEREPQREQEYCTANSISKTEADSAVDAPASLQVSGQLEIDDKIEAPEPGSELEIKEVSAPTEGPSSNNLLVSEADNNFHILEEVTETASKAQREGSILPRQLARLGRLVPYLEPASRATQYSHGNGGSGSRSSVPVEDAQLNGEADDGSGESRQKLQMIRVKFLHLAHRLGQTAHNVVVAQVLYRLGLAEQLGGGHSTSRTGAFSFERATVMAEEQEAAGEEELNFTCTIMLLGKTGVGKSATINSIFGEVKSGIDAFRPATKRVQEITGTVHGIRLRVIDTPGLLPSSVDQCHNEKIMSSVKQFIKKSPPDIVLYLDRLDMHNRDYGDIQLLRTVTDTFGAALWFNAIVVLTHASSAPPENANGVLSHEMFVTQRSHMVQQTIRQAAGDMRLMNPVALVENQAGQRVLPNGQLWKPQLLLLCFASKILAEANLLLKLHDTSSRPFSVRPRVPPLPFLLSSLLQARAQLKHPDDQMGDEDESDEDFEEGLDSEDDEDYDDLPPFRHLTKDELALLDKEQRKTYFEELEYREKLFQKKQWKEELVRRREMRKRIDVFTEEAEDGLDEKPSSVPVLMPDMALPPSFDSDNPIHRYRYLESASQWIVRPVLESHGWDHDSGYEGLNLEKNIALCQKLPVLISGQIMKDKKEANIQMECAASLRHGEGKVTLAGFDLQTIGKDRAYTLRSETRFSNLKGNKTTGGLAVTFFGNTVTAGMKIEDRLMIGRRLKCALNGGAIIGRGDVAYGGSLEATLRDKDHPLGCTLSNLGLSVMNWHGDVAIGGNLQSQFVLGKTTMMARANLNNRGAGQVTIRASSSEELQMALIGIIPLLRALFSNRLLTSSESM